MVKTNVSNPVSAISYEINQTHTHPLYTQGMTSMEVLEVDGAGRSAWAAQKQNQAKPSRPYISWAASDNMALP